MHLQGPGLEVKTHSVCQAPGRNLDASFCLEESRGTDSGLSTERDAVTPLKNHGSG